MNPADSPRPPDDKSSEIADAEHLFREGPTGSAPAARGPAAPGAGEYEILGGPEPEGDPPAPPVPPVPVAEPRPRPRARASDLPPVKRAEPEAAPVDQVWSRLAEWGPNLLLLFLVAAGVAVLLYQTFSVDNLGQAAAILGIGGAILIVLSYPLVITLERPVRITPEQAVRDYFDALAHHLPHFRRMWLLLSSAGRTSPAFSSFGEFKAYWKKRLGELRGGRVGGFTPLAFKIEDFRSDKTAAKTAASARFLVKVFARGHQSGEPLESSRLEISLSRGPDQMWYLNQGTLPPGQGP